MRPVPKTARCCPGPCGSCCLANFHICASASTSSLFLKPAAQCVTLSSSSEHQETIHSTRLTAEPSQPSWLHVNVDTAWEMNRIGAIINFWCVFVCYAIQRYRTQQRRVMHLIYSMFLRAAWRRGEKNNSFDVIPTIGSSAGPRRTPTTLLYIQLVPTRNVANSQAKNSR